MDMSPSKLTPRDIQNLSVEELFNLFVDLNNKNRTEGEEIIYKALDLEILGRLYKKIK